jgi:hypothetical protein
MKQQNIDFVNPFRNIYFNFCFCVSWRCCLTEIVPSSTLCGTHVNWGAGAARGSERGERSVRNHQDGLGRGPEARNTLVSAGPIFKSLLQADLQLHH